MAFNTITYRVMIAGPSDVQDEKDIIRKIIREWNSLNSRIQSTVLLPVDWEKDVPPEMSGQSGQMVINKRLVDISDLLIGVFWTRIGTPTKQARSGTVEEIERFIEAGKPTMIYFSSTPTNPANIDQDQYDELNEFKNECKEMGLYKEYDSKEEFEDKLRRNLNLKIEQHDYFDVDELPYATDYSEKQPEDSINEAEGLLLKSTTENNEINGEQKGETWREEQFGVTIDEDGNPILTIEPFRFFYNRMAEAFPGVRGLKIFDEPYKALGRLRTLLKFPLRFEHNESASSEANVPLWWFRGGSNNAIESFDSLSETKCLINCKELEINRIAAYRHSDRQRNFVYVEAKPEDLTGAYDITEENIKKMKDEFGYAWEEYGLLDGIPISREEFDDGAAVINDQVVDAKDAELRVRYLSKYNFFIAPHDSPINSIDFDETSRNYLDGIIDGVYDLKDFLEMFSRQPERDI